MLPMYVGAGLFTIIGLVMAINPASVLAVFENSARRSRDPLTQFNVNVFSEARREKNVRLFRIIGIAWVVIATFIFVLVIAVRA